LYHKTFTMKKFILSIFTIGFLLTACNNEPAKKATDKTNADKKEEVKSADNKTADTTTKMPDSTAMAAMMKAWEDFAKPGAMHQWMAKTNGTWEAEVNQWMGTPEPTKAKATIIQSSILGGRYTAGKFISTMMGQPMEGMSTMGYDNAKKMFTSTWVDNLGTGIVHMSGNYDEATKTLNLKGHQTDAVTGKDTDIREEMKIIDDNSYSMIMYGAGMDGKEAKFMEGIFKRKK
jgi:hypothetical protein